VIIRGQDQWGSGAFGASRGNRPHLGVDIVVDSNSQVYAPLDMEITRISRPYASGSFSGVAFTHTARDIDFGGRLWYFTPRPGIVGSFVRKGELIGVAQDLNDKYPGITNHLHLQLESFLADDSEQIVYNGKRYVNPINYL
jgi:hypothetical protein